MSVHLSVHQGARSPAISRYRTFVERLDTAEDRLKALLCAYELEEVAVWVAATAIELRVHRNIERAKLDALIEVLRRYLPPVIWGVPKVKILLIGDNRRQIIIAYRIGTEWARSITLKQRLGMLQ